MTTARALIRGALTAEQANAVFDVLVECAGASEWQREEFVLTQTGGRCDEFRFMGSLGSGGKFWRHRMQVSAYPEDMTPERQATIDTTNTRLAELLNEWGKP